MCLCWGGVLCVQEVSVCLRAFPCTGFHVYKSVCVSVCTFLCVCSEGVWCSSVQPFSSSMCLRTCMMMCALTRHTVTPVLCCVSLQDPYFMKNHLGTYECKLCLTLHTTEVGGAEMCTAFTVHSSAIFSVRESLSPQLLYTCGQYM